MILRYHEIFSGWQHQQPCRDTLVLLAWKKSHDIVILSFCNIVKGQAKLIHTYIKLKFLPDYLLGCTTYTITGCNLNYHKISVQCSLFTPIFIQTILLSEEINRFVTDSSRSKLSAPIAQTPPGVAMLTSPTTRRTQCSKRGLKTITCGLRWWWWLCITENPLAPTCPPGGPP